MAYGYSSNPGPAGDESEMDSLYNEGGESKGGEDRESVDQQDREENSYKEVVNIKVLQAGPDDEVKVGDERVLKVTAIHGEEATVMYAPAKKKDGEEEHDPGMHGKSMHEEDEAELDELAK